MGFYEEVGELAGRIGGNIIASNLRVWGGGVRCLFTDESWEEAMDQIMPADSFRRVVETGGSIGRVCGGVARFTGRDDDYGCDDDSDYDD